MTLTELAVVCVPLLIPITMLALVVRETWRSIQPSRLMLRGELAASRAASIELGESLDALAPGRAPDDAVHDRALAPSRGRSRGGVADPPRSRSRSARPARREHDLRRAVARGGETSCSSRAIPIGCFVFSARPRARAVRARRADGGNRAPRARSSGRRGHAFRPRRGRSPRSRSRGLGKVVLLWNEELEAAMFYTLRGMYLRQAGRETEAVEALLRATAGEKTNVYVEGARRLLADTSLAAPEAS